MEDKNSPANSPLTVPGSTYKTYEPGTFTYSDKWGEDYKGDRKDLKKIPISPGVLNTPPKTVGMEIINAQQKKLNEELQKEAKQGRLLAKIGIHLIEKPDGKISMDEIPREFIDEYLEEKEIETKELAKLAMMKTKQNSPKIITNPNTNQPPNNPENGKEKKRRDDYTLSEKIFSRLNETTGKPIWFITTKDGPKKLSAEYGMSYTDWKSFIHLLHRFKDFMKNEERKARAKNLSAIINAKNELLDAIDSGNFDIAEIKKINLKEELNNDGKKSLGDKPKPPTVSPAAVAITPPNSEPPVEERVNSSEPPAPVPPPITPDTTKQIIPHTTDPEIVINQPVQPKNILRPTTTSPRIATTNDRTVSATPPKTEHAIELETTHRGMYNKNPKLYRQIYEKKIFDIDDPTKEVVEKILAENKVEKQETPDTVLLEQTPPVVTNDNDKSPPPNVPEATADSQGRIEPTLATNKTETLEPATTKIENPNTLPATTVTNTPPIPNTSPEPSVQTTQPEPPQTAPVPTVQPAPTGPVTPEKKKERSEAVTKVLSTLEKYGKSWKFWIAIGVFAGLTAYMKHEINSSTPTSPPTASSPKAPETQKEMSWREYIQAEDQKEFLNNFEKMSNAEILSKYVPSKANPNNPSSIIDLLNVDTWDVYKSESVFEGLNNEQRTQVCDLIRKYADLSIAMDAQFRNALGPSFSEDPYRYGSKGMTLGKYIDLIKEKIAKADNPKTLEVIKTKFAIK